MGSHRMQNGNSRERTGARSAEGCGTPNAFSSKMRLFRRQYHGVPQYISPLRRFPDCPLVRYMEMLALVLPLLMPFAFATSATSPDTAPITSTFMYTSSSSTSTRCSDEDAGGWGEPERGSGAEESLLCVPHVLVINLARRVDKWCARTHTHAHTHTHRHSHTEPYQQMFGTRMCKVENFHAVFSVRRGGARTRHVYMNFPH